MAIWTLLGGAILLLAGSQVSGGKLDEQASALRPKMIWSVSNEFYHVAIDSDEELIYAVTLYDKVMVVDAEGQVTRSFQLAETTEGVRIARLIKGGGREIITFGLRSYGAKAYGTDGKLLWEFTTERAVGEVQAVDLDGDGLDEVIIGYNGPGVGLQVLDHSGNLLWKDTDLGNVFNVCAGDINGDGQMEVAAVSGPGVHVYDAHGAKIETPDWRPSFFDLLEAADVENQGCALLIGGIDRKQRILMGRGADGQQVWSINTGPAVDSTGERIFCNSAAVAKSKPWLAMGMDDGVVHVVDIAKGMIVATIRDQGRPEVGWLEADSDANPILITTTEASLNAFRLEEKPRED